VGKSSVGAGPPEDLVMRIYETMAPVVSPGRPGGTRLDWCALGFAQGAYAAMMHR
jgi:hypothetical protein